MASNSIHGTPICGDYFLEGSPLEKCKTKCKKKKKKKIVFSRGYSQIEEIPHRRL